MPRAQNDDSPSVLGLDLATRHTGICLIPRGWYGDEHALRTSLVEYQFPGKLTELVKIQRMNAVAGEILRFVGTYEPDFIVVEDYAYSRHSQSTTMQAEIGGIIKSQVLMATGDVPEPLSSGTIRKTLTGGLMGNRNVDKAAGMKVLPQKEQVQVFLENRGFTFDNGDIMDAFATGYHRYSVEHPGTPFRFKPLDRSEVLVPSFSSRRKRKKS
jgi:Holliday junction resolvasome RuvABC endonuclease subunit